MLSYIDTVFIDKVLFSKRFFVSQKLVMHVCVLCATSAFFYSISHKKNNTPNNDELKGTSDGDEYLFQLNTRINWNFEQPIMTFQKYGFLVPVSNSPLF